MEAAGVQFVAMAPEQKISHGTLINWLEKRTERPVRLTAGIARINNAVPAIIADGAFMAGNLVSVPADSGLLQATFMPASGTFLMVPLGNSFFFIPAGIISFSAMEMSWIGAVTFTPATGQYAVVFSGFDITDPQYANTQANANAALAELNTSTIGGAGGYVSPALDTTNDVLSTALTSTATATVVALNSSSYQVEVVVGAVSGTNPTLDIVINESDDAGANVYQVYQFPRITATGTYRSPPLPLTGNRIQYVQTVGGTTPSFTRAINRILTNLQPAAFRQTIANAPSLLATGVVGNSINVQMCRNLQMIVAVGTAFTVAAQIQLQGSDDNGSSWYNIGSALSTGTVANTTVQTTINNVNSQLVRANVTTQGTVGTCKSVTIKGF